MGRANRLESWLEAEQEQIGLWLPVALGCGIVAWFALPNQAQWVGWIVGCCALALVSLGLPGGGRLQRAVLLLALLAAAGLLLVWGKALIAGEKPIARAAVVTMRARVQAVEQRPAQGIIRVVLRPDPARGDLPGRVRVNIASGDVPPALARGAVVEVRARLMPPAPPAVPGGYDFARKAYFSGIGAAGRALPPVRVIEAAGENAKPLRERVSAYIQTRIEGGSGAIAAALATGDTGAIPESDAEAMRRSGLAHLLSISGLHVSAMVGAVIFLVFRLLALSRRLALDAPLPLIAAGAGALAGLGYTLFTGAEVPTVRSCVAALLVLAGLAMGRDAIGLRLIAAGALVVLLFWPEALVGPSFQMSFAAVTALVALAQSETLRALTHRREEGMAARLARALAALLLTGIAVELALMPIALYHFHQSGLLGSLANLVAIPLTTFVVMPAEAVALTLDLAGMGAPFWWVAGSGLDLLLAIAHGVAAHPFAVLALPAQGGGTLAAMMLGGLWLLLWRTRARFLGLVPLALGVIAIVTAPLPDLLVTGDGRHLAVRMESAGDRAQYALLRDRAGDYVRETFGSVSGDGKDAAARLPGLEGQPGVTCSPDSCIIVLHRPARKWVVLAIRSKERLPWAKLIAACARADLVVSERRLPRGCTPRWRKLDRAELTATGGVAVLLDKRRIVTVRSRRDDHPWMTP